MAMATVRNLEALSERLGVIFSTALVAVFPIAAALLLIESL
jgi:hypothetical protein